MNRPAEDTMEKGDVEPPRYEESAQEPRSLQDTQDGGRVQGVAVNDTWTQVTTTLQPVLGMLMVIKPTFLGKTSSGKTKLRRTAYLDGLRGFAALLVYVLHHELWAHEDDFGASKIEGAWGYKGQYYFAAFWGIRTFITGGHYAVAVFFVLSGYVLSTKPLSQLQNGEFLAFYDGLASGMFRRWLRLFLPVLATTLIWLNIWYFMGFTVPIKVEKTYGLTLWKWYAEMKNWTFLFQTGGEPWVDWNPHTWSIPVEMKGSLAIFTTLLAVSRATRDMRLWVEVALIFYFMYIADGAHFAHFLGGMFLCDMDLLEINNNLPSWVYWFKPYQQSIWYGMFIISNIMGSPPSFSAEFSVLKESPFWRHLAWMKPQAVFDFKWFYLWIAAMTIVPAVGRIPWLKRFFETRFCQYLGRVSYMFYLVHGPIMWTLGDRMYAAVGWHREAHAIHAPGWTNRFPLPKFGVFGIEFSFLACHLILLPVTLWVAEIFTVLIDDTSIKFVQWLYKRTLAPPSEKPWL